MRIRFSHSWTALPSAIHAVAGLVEGGCRDGLAGVPARHDGRRDRADVRQPSAPARRLNWSPSSLQWSCQLALGMVTPRKAGDVPLSDKVAPVKLLELDTETSKAPARPDELPPLLSQSQ
jgi:hypothetical protein